MTLVGVSAFLYFNCAVPLLSFFNGGLNVPEAQPYVAVRPLERSLADLSLKAEGAVGPEDGEVAQLSDIEVVVEGSGASLL